MFIDRKLECQILAYASLSSSNTASIGEARTVVSEKLPRTREKVFYEHLKRLHELQYVECSDCTLGFDTAEQVFTNDALTYRVTQQGEEYLQAMLQSDLFEF
ncbi:MAG: hypothetical protein MI749_02190 [Desulfovibrionales bacterium]|nr:hypothetical protein [Desulfovibrionales bacterium]